MDKDRERQNARSRTQERKRAQQVGGKVQAGSGSSWRARQDVKGPEFLESLKYTDKTSFVLKESELLALQKDAHQAGREPKMLIDFPSIRIIIVIEEK